MGMIKDYIYKKNGWMTDEEIEEIKEEIAKTELQIHELKLKREQIELDSAIKERKTRNCIKRSCDILDKLGIPYDKDYLLGKKK